MSTILHPELLSLTQQYEQLPKIQIQRQLKVDSIKNQKLALQACQRKDFDTLNELISMGLNLNFHHNDNTVMTHCVNNDWIEGIELLLENDYKEESIPNFFTATDFSNSSLYQSLRHQKYEIFNILSDHYSLDHQSAVINAVSHNLYFYQELLKANKTNLINSKNIQSILLNSASYMNYVLSKPAIHQLRESFNQLLQQYQSQPLSTEEKSAFQNALWIQILRSPSSSFMIMEQLVKHQIFPRELTTDSGPLMVSVSPSQGNSSCAMSSYVSETLVKPSYGSDYLKTDFNATSKKNQDMDLITAFSLLNDSSYYNKSLNLTLLHVLLNQPTYFQAFQQNPLGIHHLTHIANRALILRLQQLNFDLNLLKDDKGNNPLHIACSKSASKTTIEALARCHPEWIIAKNHEQKNPAETLPARSGSLSVVPSLLEKIAMKDLLKHMKKDPQHQSKPKQPAKPAIKRL